MALINFLSHFREKEKKDGVFSIEPAKPLASPSPTPALNSNITNNNKGPVLKLPENNKIPDKPLSKSSEEFDVNLIPVGLRVDTSGNVIWFKIILVLVVAWLMVEAGNVYISRQVKAQDERKSALSLEIEKLRTEAQIEVDKSKEIKQFTKRLAQLAKLLDSHIYWSGFFDILERKTLPDVYFINLAADARGSVTLNGMAKDLVTVAQQVVALRKDPKIKEVSIGSVSFKKAKEQVSKGVYTDKVVAVAFTVSITIDQGLLLKPLVKKNQDTYGE